jgi:hypothetical protein
VNGIVYLIAALAITLGGLGLLGVLMSERSRRSEASTSDEAVTAAVKRLVSQREVSIAEVRRAADRRADDPLLGDMRRRVAGDEQEQASRLRRWLILGEDETLTNHAAPGGIGGVALEAFATDPKIRELVLGALRLTSRDDPTSPDNVRLTLDLRPRDQ